MPTTLPNRHSIRLRGYDYSESGLYFVTICTRNRECLFGDIVDGKMILNETGKIIETVWESLPDHHPVVLDEFQIMPNHIHFILETLPSRRGIARNAPTFGNVTAGSLPCIIRSFKSECTKLIRVKSPNIHIFQRNYYEHIIRAENDLNKIREYVNINPLIWDRDHNNLESTTGSP